MLSFQSGLDAGAHEEPSSPVVQESASSSSSDASFASVLGTLVRALPHLPEAHSRTPLCQVMTGGRSGATMTRF